GIRRPAAFRRAYGIGAAGAIAELIKKTVVRNACYGVECGSSTSARQRQGSAASSRSRFTGPGVPALGMKADVHNRRQDRGEAAGLRDGSVGANCLKRVVQKSRNLHGELPGRKAELRSQYSSAPAKPMVGAYLSNQAVIDAVDHDRQAFQLRPSAGAAARVQGYRPGDILDQLA